VKEFKKVTLLVVLPNALPNMLAGPLTIDQPYTYCMALAPVCAAALIQLLVTVTSSSLCSEIATVVVSALNTIDKEGVSADSTLISVVLESDNPPQFVTVRVTL